MDAQSIHLAEGANLPKRIVDGDALWRSQKLSLVQPPRFRAEFANLIPLALANGVFEADPDLLWATVYSYNRPDVSREDVGIILAEFERVGLLRRWQDVNGIPYALNGIRLEGKVWGYWIGIEKPGRLPGQSRQGKNERIGPTPPKSVDSIKQLEDSIKQPSGTNMCLGSGSGSGSGSGRGPNTSLQYSQTDFDERDQRLLAQAKKHISTGLKACVGTDSVSEAEFMSRVCEEAGLTPLRVQQLEKMLKWPVGVAQ